ncbi:type III restriction endonuclease subunit R [Pokkaliibacter plantistimulans]|uniref:Type III restriction endonuclease subunit R n=1 Tax=Proteobacteria bacterium 228 TaxID=2083153 RepID=A0A2S5KI72_9PROT|nr:DEAD/DEAH box helicase family protein [Pokkaliibacter plantistimulans]PPC74209.1 type III restriction endonuclease subunit R [Pokkaliibacter plantistimulans]
MVVLPPVVYEQRCSVGKIRHQLQPAIKTRVINETLVNVSPRIRERLWLLECGSRVLLTNRPNVTLPDGVDGIIHLREDKVVWRTHRLLIDLKARVLESGWADVACDAARSWHNQLSYRAEQRDANGQVPTGQEGLRPPQLGALFAIGAHWSLNTQPATIVMPTGTGKTETMLATLTAYGHSTTLVVVPWDLLRQQTANKFQSLGLLRALGVLPNEVANPVVGLITSKPKTLTDLDIFTQCNVVVSTISSLAFEAGSPLAAEMAQRCKSLILDEAHHVPAKTWSGLRSAFHSLPILQFTATPFRRDGELVDGKVIFNYSLAAAQRDGYFKPIHFEPVHQPSGGTQADQAIAATALTKLRHDLNAGLNHLLLARCSSIVRATNVERLYRHLAPEFQPILIHSKINDTEAKLSDLRSGVSRVVICVDMLGEGFDLPELKVAALHDSHRSLAITLQFIGRFTRVAGRSIGEATVVANIGDQDVAHSLERLYSEDADWNQVLSELSSNAVREHRELIEFLQESERLDEEGDSKISLSPQLLRPVFSTAAYRAQQFFPERFHHGLSQQLHIEGVWLNREMRTLYFVTRAEGRVRWTNTKGVLDREWTLFVLHHNPELELLFLSSTDHSSLFPELAEEVTGQADLIHGEQMFRILGHINRLVFQNMGVKKHGRRNLSYAMYTGADVAVALGVAERSGSVKNNVSGTGWENGERVSVGCSYKGRVWSREQGSIPEFVHWCAAAGAKLLDDSIVVDDIIANVLIPKDVTAFPSDRNVLAVEWPAEIMSIAEDRVVLTTRAFPNGLPITFVDLKYLDVRDNSMRFALNCDETGQFADFTLTVGGETGFVVEQTSGEAVELTIGKASRALSQYLSSYPPLVRFVDLSELDGNMLIEPKDPRHLEIGEERFEAWDWAGVDITKESYWKDGIARADSIQWKAAQHFIQGDFDIVFDDDGAGEAADLVCLKEEDNCIRLALIHCKYSGGDTAGERVKDVVEVCSQAVRSAKWKWRFSELGKHIQRREDRLRSLHRPTRYLAGNGVKLNELIKTARFKPIEAEILIIQPGLSAGNRTADQNLVLAAAVAYLKETIGCDMDIVCSG